MSVLLKLFFISESKVVAKFSLFNNLCIEFFQSSMFYFVMPEYIKERKVKKIVKKYSNIILEDMEHIIYVTLSLF